MKRLASGRATGGSPVFTSSVMTVPALPLRPPPLIASARATERDPRRPLFGQLQLRAGRRQPGAEPPRRLLAPPGRAGAHLLADDRHAGVRAYRRARQHSVRPSAWARRVPF